MSTVGRPMPSPVIIIPGGRTACGGAIGRLYSGGTPATGVSPWSDAANCLLAFPFRLEAPTTFYGGGLLQGSGGANGTNWEIGIWDAAYNKVTTTGSFAGDANNDQIKAASFAAQVTLPPGLYYGGIAHDSTGTNQIHRYSGTLGIGHFMAAGCWRQSGVTLGSLASTATPGDLTNAAFPLFGLSTNSAVTIT